MGLLRAFTVPKVSPPPDGSEAAFALELLHQAPGPSPWYLAGHPDAPQLQNASGPLHWSSFRNSSPFAGKTVLRRSRRKALAVLDCYCYVKKLDDRHFLVWAIEGQAANSPSVGHVRFQVFDTDRIHPLASAKKACERFGPDQRFYADGAIVDLTIPAGRSDGVHDLDLPAPLRDRGEILVLAPSAVLVRDRGSLALWILDTDAGRLEIVTQDWFNDGPYDFGYQWVTRVARASRGSPLYGEGFRFGTFRLDPSLRRVSGWLISNAFVDPEGAEA